MATFWEKFTGGPTRDHADRRHASINRHCVILVNRNLHKDLGSPRAAVLFFNRANSIIGVSPAHPQLREAFPFREKDTYSTLNAAPFCRHFGISIDQTEAFVHPTIDDDGILRLDLSTTVSAAIKRKRRRS